MTVIRQVFDIISKLPVGTEFNHCDILGQIGGQEYASAVSGAICVLASNKFNLVKKLVKDGTIVKKMAKSGQVSTVFVVDKKVNPSDYTFNDDHRPFKKKKCGPRNKASIGILKSEVVNISDLRKSTNLEILKKIDSEVENIFTNLASIAELRKQLLENIENKPSMHELSLSDIPDELLTNELIRRRNNAKKGIKEKHS